MSSVVIAGDTSGSITLQAPAVAGTTTLTLPTTSGTLGFGGMDLLGTLITTSGTTQELAGLDLTDYVQITIYINGISHNGTNAWPRILAADGTTQLALSVGTAPDNTNFIYSAINIDLSTGVINANTGTTTAAPPTWSTGTTSLPRIGNGGWSTSTTSFTFSFSTGSFDAGSILVYGVK